MKLGTLGALGGVLDGVLGVAGGMVGKREEPPFLPGG